MKIQEAFGIKIIINGKPCLLSFPLLDQLKKWKKAYDKTDKNASEKFKTADYLCFEEGLHSYTLCDVYHLPCCSVSENLTQPDIINLDEDELIYKLYPILLPLNGVPFPEGEFAAQAEPFNKETVLPFTPKPITWRTINGITIATDFVLKGKAISLLNIMCQRAQ